MRTFEAERSASSSDQRVAFDLIKRAMRLHVNPPMADAHKPARPHTPRNTPAPPSYAAKSFVPWIRGVSQYNPSAIANGLPGAASHRRSLHLNPKQAAAQGQWTATPRLQL